jgi:hypothetical protein
MTQISKQIIPAVAGTGDSAANTTTSQPSLTQVNVNVALKPASPREIEVQVDLSLRPPQINGCYRRKNAEADDGTGEIVVLGYDEKGKGVQYRTAGQIEEPTWMDSAGFYSTFTPIVRTSSTLPTVGQRFAARANRTEKIVVVDVVGSEVHYQQIFNARVHGHMDLVKFEDYFCPSR